MKVLFDHQIFEAQTSGGISRYFNEIITHFNHSSDIKAAVPPMYSDNVYIQSNPAFNLCSHTTNKKSSLFPYIYNFIHPHKVKRQIKQQSMKDNLDSSITALKNSEYDIFHPTYYNPYFLQYIGNTPFVLTIYDMTYAKFADIFPSTDKTLEQMKLLAEKANMIIAISQSTKDDIIQILKIPDKKIEVIYLGNSIVSDKTSRGHKHDLPDKYLLFIGRRGLYKNFEFFISSIAGLLTGTDLMLICIGGNFSNYENKLLKKLKIKKNVLHCSPKNDDELSQYYAKAKALCFPSKYEGFGLPILEAFANNCPVIASNTSSLPEIAGDAAVYFNPTDNNSILNAVKKVLVDTDLRKYLAEKGRQNLEKFSWDKTAGKTKNLYLKVLNNIPHTTK